MVDLNNMSQKSILKEQYKTPDNLNIRKNLHNKYSVNKTGLQKWTFDQYPFRPQMKILEVGSGKGDLWNHYFADETLQSYKMDITLSDKSILIMWSSGITRTH